MMLRSLVAQLSMICNALDENIEELEPDEVLSRFMPWTDLEISTQSCFAPTTTYTTLSPWRGRDCEDTMNEEEPCSYTCYTQPNGPTLYSRGSNNRRSHRRPIRENHRSAVRRECFGSYSAEKKGETKSFLQDLKSHMLRSSTFASCPCGGKGDGSSHLKRLHPNQMDEALKISTENGDLKAEHEGDPHCCLEKNFRGGIVRKIPGLLVLCSLELLTIFVAWRYDHKLGRKLCLDVGNHFSIPPSELGISIPQLQEGVTSPTALAVLMLTTIEEATNPSHLALSVSVVVFVLSTTYLYHERRADVFQDRFLLFGAMSATVAGIVKKLEVQSIMLSVLPGATFCVLVLSAIAHWVFEWSQTGEEFCAAHCLVEDLPEKA